MTQRGKSGKKIVTKSKYVQVQSLRLGVAIAGFCLLFAALASCVLTIILFLMLLPMLAACLGEGQWTSFALFLGYVAATLFMFQGTRLLWKFGVAALDTTDTMDNTAPLTRATISDVSARESLVRASEEPHATPETILLRATTENPTTPPEQLVRSSGTPE